MKRIESFLGEFNWPFKVIIVLLFIFWACQLFDSAAWEIYKEVDYQRNRNFQIEAEARREVYNFISLKVNRAKALGTAYSPQKYFSDLKEITILTDSLRTAVPTLQINQLQQILENNVKKGRYSNSEISVASQSYQNWLNGGRYVGSFKNDVKKLSWFDILSWLIAFYLRTMLLVLFFYLIRMAQRKGILETILANKKKFVLSILIWPVFFFKYPNNVVREIVVEAELRRIGRSFRKLTEAERKLVKHVANSNYYHDWLIAFHEKNAALFQRGLIVAFIITLFYLFTPFFVGSARASEKHSRSNLIVLVQSVDQLSDTQIGAQKNLPAHSFWEKINDFVLKEKIIIDCPQIMERLKQLADTIRECMFAKKIDHIPLVSLLGLGIIKY